MAIPFRFKDAPSERTEFGHPDLAITLTLRSYYEDGLTRDSFLRVLEWLRGLPSLEQGLQYSRWLWAAAEPNDFCSTAGESVDKAVARRLELPRSADLMTDDEVFIERLWRKFAKNMNVIETYLEEFVFPKETRQFPFKVWQFGVRGSAVHALSRVASTRGWFWARVASTRGWFWPGSQG